MGYFTPRGLGWLPCAPDFRDYSPGSPPVHEQLLKLRDAGGGVGSARAQSVDLREYFLDVDDQQELKASSAHAVAAMAEYFERRANGRVLRPSRLFLYQNTLKLAGVVEDAGADLRNTLKALVLCGAPSERLWPYDPTRLTVSPEAFHYSFTAPYREVSYLRLDGRKSTGALNLQSVKSFVAAGFVVAFGLAVPNVLPDDGNIPYRPTFDALAGGQALLAVGYDDRWLRGTRGALLVRSSWGRDWGEDGYGWLPYAFVEEQLAVDFWTMLHHEWINSGEFALPDILA